MANTSEKLDEKLREMLKESTAEVVKPHISTVVPEKVQNVVEGKPKEKVRSSYPLPDKYEPLPVEKSVTLKVDKLPFQVNEAINTLRGNIQLSGFELKVIGITSALKHEGKSSLSFRLAKSFAALGVKTLYLDCDIRNSQTMMRYSVAKQVTGLTEYLIGKAKRSDIVYKSDDQYLSIIFTGAVAPNPSELFSGDRFKKLIGDLRNDFDYIIVDTPPINAVIDGVLIAKECDGTLMVIESGATDRIQARRAKQQMEYAGVKILGVALNKVGTKRSGYGYGYGYGKYGYGYGYGKYGYGYGYGEENLTRETDRKKKSSDNRRRSRK